MRSNSPLQSSSVVSKSGLSALLLLTGSLGACESCVDPQIIKVAPQIFVDVCAEPQKVVNNVLIGGFSECALAFGDSDLSVRAERTFVITNPSNLALNIESLEFEGDPGFAFVEAPPTVIPAGLSAQVGVTIRPQLESTITGEIVIVSDANNTPVNDEQKSEVRIPMTLTGVDNGVPDIEIIPGDCAAAGTLAADFGRIATGGVAICNVEVRNNGTRELFFDAVEFVDAGTGPVSEPAGSDATPAFAITGIIPGPDTPLRPTSAEVPPLTLRLTFAPDVLGRFTATIRFDTSDPDEPSIELPISGIGVVGPTCVAEVKSVNTVLIDGGINIEPLDDVVLTTVNSTPATPEGNIVATRWTLEERGADSTVQLSSPATTETGFVFANRRGVDVAGRYEACAIVTDDLGTDSNNRCCVDFEAIPSQAFLVQLTWAQDFGDMDLHVTKKDAGGDYCVQSLGGGSTGVDAPFTTGDCGDNSDCGFYNCRADAGGSPNWDTVTGRTTGDPSLDIDDLNGFGPENINVDLAVAGSYGFGATTFSSGAFLMTMRLFVFGRLAGEWQEEIDSDFWEVGLVHFTADDPTRPCVEDLTDGDPNDQCPGL
jgi:hypothetical protein